jgi:hypothetical protein
MSDSKTLDHQALANVVPSTLTTPKRTIHIDIPSISPVSRVRTSDSATTVTVARHQPLAGESRAYSDYPPYLSNPTTAVNSRAPSPTKEIDAEYEYGLSRLQDRLKWRLASGFFAIFLGGWADGGKLISASSLTKFLANETISVTGTVIPCMWRIANVLYNIGVDLSSQIYRKTFI